MSKIKEFLDNVKAKLLSESEIRSFLLSLNKKEFLSLISSSNDNDPQGIPDIDIENMTQNHITIISEIIGDLTIEEKKEVLPNISNDFYTIEQLIFKTLPIKEATEVFTNNPIKYKDDITLYIETPRSSNEKDHLIATILSNEKLYKLFTEEERSIFKTLISNNLIILEKQYNLCNITYDDLKNALARYLANIDYHQSKTINQGIHEKINSKNIYQIFIEVNKGLKRIDSPILTEEDIISKLELPFEKSVIFLNQCLNLTDEEISSLLLKYYPINKELIINKDINQLVNIVYDLSVPEIDQ